MQIDWLTVAAQVVNFLILVYLLRRFLYRPIIDAMARRQVRIAKQLADAEARAHEADAAAHDFQARTSEFERTKADLLAAAERDVEARRKDMLEAARRDVDASRAAWQQSLEREQREFLTGMREQAASALVRTVRRTLDELANATLEREIVLAFLHRLSSLDAAGREALRGSVEGGVEIVSSFELDADTRNAVERTLGQVVFDGRTPAPSYRRAERLICGIELRTAGYKLGWSMDGYMDAFEHDIAAAFPAAAGLPEGEHEASGAGTGH
jgi:F-type H+-transporting ATPase subunit b